jgi:hypothetical protein
MHDQDQHIPEAVAKRVLMRAAQLDASRKTSLSIPDLRAAALEAGISSSALDQALNEVTNSEEDSTESGSVGRRPRRRLITGVAIAITLLVLATSWVFMREVAVPVEEEVWYPTPTAPPAPPLPWPQPPVPAPVPAPAPR